MRAPDGGMGQGDYVDGPRTCFGGGAGLLSTPIDYARFLQMLVNGGELDGVRMLSPKTIELMTANHVGTLYNDGNMGFGLGFEVIEHLGTHGRLRKRRRLRLGQRVLPALLRRSAGEAGRGVLRAAHPGGRAGYPGEVAGPRVPGDYRAAGRSAHRGVGE